MWRALRRRLAGVLLLGPLALPCHGETLFIPVLLHPVQSGQEIFPADFTTKEYEVSSTARANYVTEPGQLLGTVASKSLPADRPIPISAIGAAPVVRKGKNTVVHYLQDGIDIQGVLVPSQDALAGDTISCRNPSTGLVVNAQVLADGTLTVASQ